MATLLGTTLSGRYRLEERIGFGGMSTVYRAVDEKLERQVAIKVMNQEVATESEQLERFNREARAVARVSHVNVVGVIDAGEDGGHPYIVFEHVRGETLKQRILRDGPLPIPEAVTYSIQIARALSAAHGHHIVHRDVKPQNVLIDSETGVAKVTDFGIARTLEEDGLTSDGRVVGTSDYVSPEQALGEHVNGQSDLYSLGIVIYEMLTGELPFQGQGQVAVAMMHVRAPMPDVRELRPEVSATLAAVVEHATAKATHIRYQSDAEMIGDLEQVLALETSRAGEATGQVTSMLRSLPPDTQDRVPLTIRNRRGMIAAFGVLGVVLLAALIFVLTRAEHGPGQTVRHPPVSTVIKICSSCATAYNPDGVGGTEQNDSTAYRAVDGDPNTSWNTQTYFGGSLNKPGVGIYVSTQKAVPARTLTLLTKTPGFDVDIYGTDSTPNPGSFSDSGWKPLGSYNVVSSDQTIELTPGRAKYEYFLVWITSLPTQSDYAAINELTLHS